jgi:hypothetical protein
MKKIIERLLSNKTRDSSFITNKPTLKKVVGYEKQLSFNEISGNIRKEIMNGK